MASDSGGGPAIDVWTRERPGSRRPRLSPGRIAEVAMRLADEEGVEALSMRRLAAELDAGTMTLYHYVRTKDEVLALVIDRVMGEIIVPADELSGSWREAVTAVAHRTRDCLLRHPWMFDIAGDPSLGPNGVRHFDQSLQALASVDLDLEQRLDIIHVVDEYVFGYCLQAREDQSFDEGSPHAWAMFDYVMELLPGGDYPQLAELVDADGAESVWRRLLAHNADPERFDRNLARLLDGIERDLGLGD